MPEHIPKFLCKSFPQLHAHTMYIMAWSESNEYAVVEGLFQQGPWFILEYADVGEVDPAHTIQKGNPSHTSYSRIPWMVVTVPILESPHRLWSEHSLDVFAGITFPPLQPNYYVPNFSS